MKLDGKVAIVTGGSRGIGRGIALRFAKEGANVVVNFVTNKDAAGEVVKKITKLGREAIAFRGDVSVASDVRKLVKTTIDKFGKVDILVNNAGFSNPSPFLELTENRWDRVVNVNLKGIFLCSKAVVTEMIKRHQSGRIINITSISGSLPSKRLAHYCAAKAGANMLTKAMAVELAPHKINVNAIAPGVIKTEMSEKNILRNKSLCSSYERLIPLGLLGEVNDVAFAAIFLASDDSSYITGHILTVDGGWIAYLYDPGVED